MGSKNDKPVPMTDREIFDAEYPDYDFLDAPEGYPPGTTFEIDGERIDVGPPAKKSSPSSSSSRSRA